MIERLGRDITAAFGAQSELVLGLLDDEDDWSFTIKLHAVLEAAVTQAILDALGDPRLDPIVQKLTFANEQTGKLAFALALELIDQRQVRFVRSLGRIRNRLAHDVAEMSFSFDEFIRTRSESQLRQFVEELSWGAEHDPDAWPQLVAKFPQIAVAISAIPLIGLIIAAGHAAKARRESSELALQTSEEIVRDLLAPKRVRRAAL